MTAPHWHCATCFNVIELEWQPDEGEALPMPEPFLGTQFLPVPQPDGSVGIVPNRVPLCADCLEKIRAAEQAPKLLVPHGLRTVQ